MPAFSRQVKALTRLLLSRAADDARKDDLDGWLFSLDFPTYDAIMKQADSRDLRETLGGGHPIEELERAVSEGRLPATIAAERLLDMYLEEQGND